MPNENVNTTPPPHVGQFEIKYDQFAEATRAKLYAALDPDSPNALSKHDLNMLGSFLFVLEKHVSNSVTPVEDFIVGLPHSYEMHYESGHCLTPDDIVEQVNGENCREWFDDAVNTTRIFRERYKHVLDKPEAV